jgi:hypothetical protein
MGTPLRRGRPACLPSCHGYAVGDLVRYLFWFSFIILWAQNLEPLQAVTSLENTLIDHHFDDPQTGAISNHLSGRRWTEGYFNCFRRSQKRRLSEHLSDFERIPLLAAPAVQHSHARGSES